MATLGPIEAGSLKQQVVALHDPVNPLIIDLRKACIPQLAVQKCCDPAISVGRALCYQHLDAWQHDRGLSWASGVHPFAVLSAIVAPTRLRSPTQLLVHVRTGDTHVCRYGLHQEPSRLNDCASNIGFC